MSFARVESGLCECEYLCFDAVGWPTSVAHKALQR